MKSIEKLAVVAVVLYFVATVVTRVANILMFTLSNAGWSKTQITLLSVPVVAVSLAVHIAVAIWLYRVAKREQATPWVWALFGFVFGISGAILFFAFRIYEMMKIKETSEPQIAP